jgi:phosphate transport system substrate-binding protein
MSSQTKTALLALAFLASVALAPCPSHATDVYVYLCAKADPSDRIEGALVEYTKDEYVVVFKGRRTKVYSIDWEPCPDSRTRIVVEPPRDEPVWGIDTETLTFEGSGTVGFGVLPYIVKGYATRNGATVKATNEAALMAGTAPGVYELFGTDTSKPFLRVQITPSGSNNGLEALLAKRTIVGLSSRPFSDGEIDRLLQQGDSELRVREQIEKVVALDGIVVVTHPSNPIRSLEICDIAKLFAGKVQDWKDVGGHPGKVTPYVLTARSGTYQLFRQILDENCREAVSDRAVPNTSWSDLLGHVASDPGAIGFSAVTIVTPSVKSVAVKGSCGIEHLPTRFTVKTEDYPLSRRLYVYAPYKPGRNGQAFFDYLGTRAAQDDVRQGQAIDQQIELDRPAPRHGTINDQGLERDDEAQRELERDTRGAERMSITYRFKTNSDELDVKAIQDIARLAAYLQANPTTGRTLLLAGFADAFGPAVVNKRLAQKRANVVRDALARLLARNVEVKGYGEILPVACNDSDLGRARNRRVEVWLKP